MPQPKFVPRKLKLACSDSNDLLEQRTMDTKRDSQIHPFLP